MAEIIEHPDVEFQGRTYYWRLKGTTWCYANSRRGESGEAVTHRLHRDVWESVHGPIPEGGVVHHIDTNPANNDPSNLELKTRSTHALVHSSEKVELTCSVCGKVFLKPKKNHDIDSAKGKPAVCCRECWFKSPGGRKSKEVAKQWNLVHREERAEYHKKWQAEHTEEMRRKRREYEEAHKDEREEYNKKLYAENREKRLADMKLYYSTHKEEIKAKEFARKDERAETKRLWHEAHRESERIRMREWRLANREKALEYDRKYNATRRPK